MRNTGAPGITSKSSEFINFERRSRYSGWQTGLSLSHLVRKLCDLLVGLRNGICSISVLLSRPFYSVIGVMLIIIYSQTCDNASRQSLSCRGQLKCDGTRAETRFRLSAKRTSPFKSEGASVQSTTGSRGVHISGSNAGYTMF